jgi:glucosylceramidase
MKTFTSLFFGLLWIVSAPLSFADSEPSLTNPGNAVWICSVAKSPWADRSRELVVGAGNGGPTEVLKIDDMQPAEGVDGFGGCFNELGWQAMSKLSEADRQAVLNALFSDAGCAFNICRMPIGASDYALNYYSLDDWPGDMNLRHFSLDRDHKCLIPYIKAAMAVRPGLKVWGSPWSPPFWLKDNNGYAGGSLIWDEGHRKTYAHYLAKAAQAYQQEGLNFFAVDFQNEPVAASGYPTCLWTGDHIRDFIRDDLGPAFQREKVNAQIWLGTMNSGDYVGYFLPTLSDEKARAAISGVGVQWAGKDAVAQVHQNYPRMSLMQTETECGAGENDWAYAEYTFSLMKRYFEAGVNSYMEWNMVLDHTGESHWGWKQNAMITVAVPCREVDPHVFGSGFEGEFYTDETLTTSAARHHADKIEFNWDDKPPVEGVPADHWSARWTGVMTPPATGIYCFEMSADDGERLLIDGKKVIDDWSVHASRTRTAEVTLQQNKPVPIVVEYFQVDGESSISLAAKFEDPAGAQPIYNPQFYLVKHLSNFVKPGAHRLVLHSDENALAFLNPDNRVVVAWVNTDSTPKPVRIDYQGQSIEAVLPPKSFNTLVLN